MRVLLDTNIFISYLLAAKPASPIYQVVRAGLRGEFVILLPGSLLTEFTRRVRQKPYLSARITEPELQEFISLLSTLAETIPPITQAIPRVTRDPKDDYLLAHALVGQANYLVTGDDDLLDLNQADTVTIVSPREFLSVLNRVE